MEIFGGDILGGGGENGSVWKLVENWKEVEACEGRKELMKKEKEKKLE